MQIFKVHDAVFIDGITNEEFQKLKEINEGTFNKNILPRHYVRDENGKLIKDYTTKDFFLKLQGKIFEMVDDIFRNDFECELGKAYSSTEDEVAEKIADVITVCISYLNRFGYDEKKRLEIFCRVNKKNEECGLL